MSVIAAEPVVDESKESTAKNPGYCDIRDENTKGYHVQQTVSSTTDIVMNARVALQTISSCQSIKACNVHL